MPDDVLPYHPDVEKTGQFSLIAGADSPPVEEFSTSSNNVPSMHIEGKPRQLLGELTFCERVAAGEYRHAFETRISISQFF